MNKVSKFIKKYIKFSKGFVAPIVNEQLLKEESDRQAVIRSEVEKKVQQKNDAINKEADRHNEYLTDLLKSCLGKPYASKFDLDTSIEIHNRKWLKYRKDVNNSTKVINLTKDAFKDNVKRLMEEIRVNKAIKDNTNN